MRTFFSRKGLYIVASFVFFGLLLFLPVITFAQGATAPIDPNDTFGVTQVNNTVSLTNTDFRVIVGRIIQIVLGLLGVIAVSLIVYAGFIVMTAAGNEDKVAEGKKILVNATVGLLIILSAVGIVQFVLTSLSQATGSGLSQNNNQNEDGAGIVKKSFTGSAALGKIIKDHYPARDQKEVPRNTKIVVTFNEPVHPASVMANTNNTCWGSDGKPTTDCAEGAVPYYGDCLFDKPNFSWEKDCDQLNTVNVQIYRKADPKKEAVTAAVLGMYDEDKKMYVFTFRPLSFLGDDKQKAVYIVDLTKNILKDNGAKEKKEEVSAFQGELSGHYQWEFETSLSADFIPPRVISVYPTASSTDDRNSIVQIQFSEPVDLSLLYGKFGTNTPQFAAVFKDKNITGEWRPSNGYKTLEFISDEPCGENSCGELMYCLPVPSCEGKGEECKEGYGILLRTAEFISTSTFDGKPGSGILDMSGNALDGNSNNKPDGRPALPLDKKTIAEEEKKSSFDNYWWQFDVRNSIDLSVPYIHEVVPALDGEGVNGIVPVTILFNKRMMSDSFYKGGIQIEEYPAAKNPDGKNADWWISPGIEQVGVDKSRAVIQHREFGPNGQDLFYFTSVSSTVKSVKQNCLYPGVGPFSVQKEIPVKCALGTDDEKNCIAVNKNAQTDTGCSVTDGSVLPAFADTVSCVTKLKSLVNPKLPDGN